MTDSATGPEHHSEDWAPHDYTDGRQPGDWKTRYPDEARSWIRIEAAYLVILSGLALGGVLYILYLLCVRDLLTTPQTSGITCPPFLTFLAALAAGVLGGGTFGIKWLYHSVAKQIWNEDRRLWRFLTPVLSGIVALFMVCIVASGLLQIFDKDFVHRPIAVLAFSFLVGYFSDKALAKMAELADTLLGRTDKGN